MARPDMSGAVGEPTPRLIWKVVPLLAGLMACGSETSPREPGRSADGALVYQVCLGCHGLDGHGVAGGLAPSLVGSDLVLSGDAGPLIHLLLHGIKNDGTWPGVMMPWRDALDDHQIAAVLNHIRSQWGNEAPAVTSDEVREIRLQTSDRKAPYARDELREL